MTHSRTTLVILAFSCLLGSPICAGTIYSPAEDADIQRRNDNDPPINVTGVSSDQLLAGCAGAVGQDRCVVIPIQLPNLGAVTNPFTVASFVFNFEGKNNTVRGNVDVYGLGRRSAPDVVVDDYWTATSSVDSTDAALLAESVITENSTSFGLRDVGGSSVAAYLNAQYAGGAGAGDYVFFRLSVDEAQTGGASRYLITSADVGTPETAPRLIYNEEFNPPSTVGRPFIWVRDSDKPDILAKIDSQPWAQSVFNGMVNRVAGEVSDHQSNRDSFLRDLPVLWNTSPPRYKTYPAYSEARAGSKDLFDAALDSAVLYYLTGDEKYARCAADILHNATTTILPLTPSTNVGNGGWVFSDTTNGYGLLYEARIMGAQLPVVYDFLHGWLQSNQVYDVDSGGMVDFSFGDAQEVFRTYYELTRDRGSKDSNWSALMASCMLHSLLALDDQAERDAALQVYLTTGSPRQASLDYDYRHYGEEGSVWPESLQYASAVGEIRSAHMVMIERYNPELTLLESYPNFPLSLPRIRDFRYPGGSEQISFGDGKRRREGESFFEYEMIYRHAKDRGYEELKTLMGELINGGIAANNYDRAGLRSYASLGRSNEPLQLLWQEPVVTEAPAPLELPRTDILPHAGITLQRNESPNGDANYGLMGHVGGASFIHSHASGMSMELFGMGEVMGAKSGRDNSYQTTLQKKYYRLFASNNTVIVNGASIGDGGWKNLGINTVNTVSMEPQPFESAVSSDLSFTTSSFNDNKGNLAEATQQRTLALVRTSDTSGFYVDLFRSDSSVTNRTATTLEGNVTDEYHDYIYRNIGDLDVTLEMNGSPLSLVDQSNRFQNDVGTQWDQPGWRYFSNTRVSYPQQGDLFARFKATPSGRSSVYMSMHMPAVSDREVAKTDSPSIKNAPSPYDNRDAPTLVVRKIGEAWDKPFLSVFEPHFGASGGTVQETTALWRDGTVVGVKVESLVGGNPVTHYIFSNPNDNQIYTDPAVGLSFQGRFGIVADFGGNEYELYIGDGRSISYRGSSMTSVGGDTEASMVLRPGEDPVVTSNAPVEIVTGVLGSPLVAHWPLDEGAGAIASDVSGYGTDGMLRNGASWDSDTTRDSYVLFDGENDRIETSFTYALADTDDFTWAWWAKKTTPSGTDNGSIMVGNRYGGAGSENFEFIKFTPVGAQFADTDTASQIGRYDHAVPTGVWQHYAMVKSGSRYQLYVNGIAQESTEPAFTYDETSPIPFFIGGDDDGSGTRVNEHFEGGIDDVVLYRSALTQQEVENVINGIYLPVITLTTLDTPVDSMEPTAWSDGEAPHGGASYVIPSTGNVRGETGTSTFPGTSLTVEAGGRYQVRSTGSNVSTVDQLLLSGGSSFGAGDFAELAAGTGNSETNVLDGTLTNSGFSRLLSFGTTSGGAVTVARNLKVLSLISGTGRIQAFENSADGLSSVIIDNSGNGFLGTWEVATGSSLVFNNAGAVGTANIEVMAGGALEIKGNWSVGAALAVADAPNTSLDLGPYGWKVSNLYLGSTSVSEGVYTAAELNALSVNPLFTGLGTVTVGAGLPGGPIAHWKLDEGSGITAIDSSGGGKAGELVTGATWSSDATRGTFVSFDGSTGRITTPFTYSLASSDDFTWTWWANKQSSDGDDSSAIMVGNRYGGGGSESLEFIKFMPLNATLVNGGLDDREDYDYDDLTNDGWHHYAMVKSGTEYRWYVDGMLMSPEGSAAEFLEINYSETDSLPFNIGGDDNDEILGGKNGEHFAGFIDDVALYDRPLTLAEVQGVRDGNYGSLPLNNAQEDWRMLHFGTTDDAGTAADDYDANFDGENNFLEFASGQDPFATTLVSTSLEQNGDMLEFRYVRSKAALADGMIFEVKWSDTLLDGSWSSGGVADVLDTAFPGDAEVEHRIATVPVGNADRRFMRLRISRP